MAAGASSPSPPRKIRAAPRSRLRALCDYLAKSPDSPVRKYTPAGADINFVIDVRAIFQQAHRELAVEAMPAFLFPGRAVTSSATMKRCSVPI